MQGSPPVPEVPQEMMSLSMYALAMQGVQFFDYKLAILCTWAELDLRPRKPPANLEKAMRPLRGRSGSHTRFMRVRPGMRASTPQTTTQPFDCSTTEPLDAGLRPGPFPDRAASLLSGVLAAAWTRLAPAVTTSLCWITILHISTSNCMGAPREVVNRGGR